MFKLFKSKNQEVSKSNLINQNIEMTEELTDEMLSAVSGSYATDIGWALCKRGWIICWYD
jgi:hypothetical protein